MGTVEGSRAPAVVGVTTAALVISLITTTLRCFVRICLVKAFGSDDWLMVGATVSFILYSSFSLAGVRYGTGQHMQNLQPEDASKALKWWWLCYLTYSATMLLAKLSIAWFLLRVAVKPVHKWIIYIGMTLTVVGSMAFFFACIFQCWPVSYFWDRSQEGSCTENGVVLALSYVFSTINIVSDFIFALLPAWIVSHLNMKLKTKVALIGLMGMGCVASAAVIVRIPYMKNIASDDFLYDTAYIAVWSAVEECLSITAGGLATLQPLIKLIGYKLGMTSHPMVPGTDGVSTRYGHIGVNGTISVRRSFTRKTEVFMPHIHDIQHEEGALKLQPGMSTYTAMCYNTSQEELRDDGNTSDGIDSIRT